MKKIGLVSLIGIGIIGPSCGAVDVDEGASEGVFPLLSESDRAIVAQMEANTLADLEVPGGRVRFIEVEPGVVVTLHDFEMGADLTRIKGGEQMSLDQLFRAYAPHRPVPQRLLEAMNRIPASGPEVEDLSTPPGVWPGLRPTSSERKANDPRGTEKIVRQLTSAIPQDWFVRNFCGFTHVDNDWCFTTAFQGAFGSRKSHRHEAAVCGDTGAARFRVRVSGSDRLVVDVRHGRCNMTGRFHRGHNIFGAKTSTITTTVIFAESTVRFSGFHVDDDGFITAPPAFL